MKSSKLFSAFLTATMACGVGTANNSELDTASEGTSEALTAGGSCTITAQYRRGSTCIRSGNYNVTNPGSPGAPYTRTISSNSESTCDSICKILLMPSGPCNFTLAFNCQSSFVPSMDFNKDNKQDRVSILPAVNANRFMVSLSTSTGFAPATEWLRHGGPATVKGQTQYPDINGDGRTDIVYQGVDNSFWVSITKPDGKGFYPPAKWTQHGGGFVYAAAQYSDLNRDGKADLIVQGKGAPGSPQNEFWVSLTNPQGNGFLPYKRQLQHGGPYLPGHAQYSGDRVVFIGSDLVQWVSYYQNGFSTPSWSGRYYGP